MSITWQCPEARLLRPAGTSVGSAVAAMSVVFALGACSGEAGSVSAGSTTTSIVSSTTVVVAPEAESSTTVGSPSSDPTVDVVDEAPSTTSSQPDNATRSTVAAADDDVPAPTVADTVPASTTLPDFAPPTTLEPLPPVGSNADLEQGGVCPLLDDRSVTDAFGSGISVGEAGTDGGTIICRWHGGNPRGDRVVASVDDPTDSRPGTAWSAEGDGEPVDVGPAPGRIEEFGDGARVTFEGLDLTEWTVSVVHPDGASRSAEIAVEVARRML